jgi:hypothetical protein
MRLALHIVLALPAVVSAACSHDAEKPAEPSTPSRNIAAIVRYEAPKGWRLEEYANNGGAEPVVAFADGLDRITVRVYGAPGSSYATPADFVAGPAASTMGREPEKIGRVTVAGQELDLYRHGFPIHLGDPHAPSGPVTLGKEIFCVLPAANGRFVVLAFARESQVPDLEPRGERAWEAFLETVKLVGRIP